MQRDPGQPRPKRAGPGDEQAEAAFHAHGSREIVGFAEHRGNAARHSRRPLPVAPRVRRLLGAWPFNFGRNSEGRWETFQSFAIIAIILKSRHHIAKIITYLAWENGPTATVTSP